MENRPNPFQTSAWRRWRFGSTLTGPRMSALGFFLINLVILCAFGYAEDLSMSIEASSLALLLTPGVWAAAVVAPQASHLRLSGRLAELSLTRLSNREILRGHFTPYPVWIGVCYGALFLSLPLIGGIFSLDSGGDLMTVMYIVLWGIWQGLASAPIAFRIGLDAPSHSQAIVRSGMLLLLLPWSLFFLMILMGNSVTSRSTASLFIGLGFIVWQIGKAAMTIHTRVYMTDHLKEIEG